MGTHAGAEPELAPWRRAALADPKTVPPSAFDERVYEQLLAPAVGARA